MAPLLPIQAEDIVRYRFLSGLRLSDDARHAAFAVHQSNEERDGYLTDLWLCGTDAGDPVKKLTSSGDVGSYCWLDSETLLFSSKRRRKPSEGTTDFYTIPLGGGEAEHAFTVPAPVEGIEPLGGSRYVILASFDNRHPDLTDPGQEKRDQANRALKEEEDYVVAEELPFWSNGNGIVDRKRSRLFIFDAGSGTMKAITRPMYRVAGWNLNASRDRIVYFGSEFDDVESLVYQELCLYDIRTEATTVLVANGRYQINHAQFMADDILFLGSDCTRYGLNENGVFYVVDGEGRITLFYGEDFTLGNSVNSDCRYGGGTDCKICEESLLFITTDRSCSRLCRMTSDGLAYLTAAEGSVDCFDGKDGKCLFIGMRGAQLEEVYVLDMERGLEHQLTHFSDESLAGKAVSRPRPLAFRNEEGLDMDGWVIEPADYDPGRKYPAILDIHGGPKTAYGTVFFHEMQVWAALGYFVLFCNPRGSDGRGNEFADIRGLYGGPDYRDIMAFVDCALENYPAIDSKRLGVTGGSYGGFMTNWIIGHTDRFAAAVSQRSIASWVSMECVSDIGPDFVRDQTGGSIQDGWEKLWQQSPLTYAGRCTTPTLLLHSREDYRCPECEGIQMFSALKRCGVPARLVLFKGENHELSRSGSPKHRLRRLAEISDWFERYLRQLPS